MLKLIKVSGHSLRPAYRDGDFVLVCKIPSSLRRIKPGDIIVFKHRAYGTLIKRVESVSPNRDEIYVMGTQSNSVDSRRFGAIQKRDIIGKVIWHIKKPTADPG